MSKIQTKSGVEIVKSRLKNLKKQNFKFQLRADLLSRFLFSAHFKALKHLETKSFGLVTSPQFQKGIIHDHSLL